MKKRNVLAIALLLASTVSLTAVSSAQAPPTSAPIALSATQFAEPAEQLRVLIGKIRRNEILAAIQLGTPASHLEAAKSAFEAMRVKPTTDTERARFEAEVGKLLAPDAVDQMMLELEPKLVEARPKLPGAMLMGMGALKMLLASDDPSLSDSERASIEAVLPGLEAWAAKTDFLSSLHARQALSVLSDAARNTGIRSIDALKALSFEQAVEKSALMLQAGKQAMAIYGIDVNAILDSAKVEVLENDGKKARLRTTFTVFGGAVKLEHDSELIEGKWISMKSESDRQFGKKRAPAEKVDS